VTVVAWPADMTRAVALAEMAEATADWPGLGRRSAGPLRLVLAPDQETFTRIGRGRAPGWGVGLAFPTSGTIVLRGDDPDLTGTLRHELAHLVLHRAIAVRVPLWFDEGYASWAAGEFGRADALALNFAVIRRQIPTLRELDAALRGTANTAATAYALAASAVLELGRRTRSGSLDPLMERLEGGQSFADAVLGATGFTLDRFDETWRRSVRRRYSLVTWFAASGMWLLLAGAVVGGYAYRRRREAPRRARLDVGWDIPDWQDPEAPQNGVEVSPRPDDAGDPPVV